MKHAKSKHFKIQKMHPQS